MDKFTPVGVSVSKSKKKLFINWKDGHASVYPFGGLRKSCPCVFCQGGHEAMGKEIDPIVFLTDTSERLDIVNVKQAGNYAIQVFWNDGHNTGIYRWEYLRNGCPVEAGILPLETNNN